MEKQTRMVGVSGGPGRDPKIDKWTVQVTIDYTDVDRGELIKRAFAHDVIALQNGRLRKMTVAELNALQSSATGYECNGAEIGNGKRGAVDVIAASERKFETLSPEEQMAYIARLQAKAANKG